MSSMTPPTLRSVAELAGVSTATVVRVIRGEGPVAESTRARVVEAIDRTGYRINVVASTLRRQRTDTIGHVLTGVVPNPFFVEVSVGLQDAAAAAGFDVLMYSAHHDRARERAGVEAFLGRRVDAIVFTTPLAEENVRLAMSAGVRVVQVERPYPLETAQVVVDNFSGSRAATEHLVRLGHRRIQYWGWHPEEGRPPGWYTVEADRVAGYRSVLAAEGLEPRAWAPGGADRGSGFRGELRRDADAGRRPSAILAGSDQIAAEILQAAHALGLRVPEDLSLVGFDDTYAEHLTPPLTTVALPMREMGAAAFRGVVAANPTHREALQSRLVIRDSTAPPR